jgi:hypothetical protein
MEISQFLCSTAFINVGEAGGVSVPDSGGIAVAKATALGDKAGIY